MKASGIVIYFPKHSKPKPTPKKKKPGQKATVLEWIRNGWQFPGKPAPRGAQ
jgi:hypothetical protein